MVDVINLLCLSRNKQIPCETRYLYVTPDASLSTTNSITSAFAIKSISIINIQYKNKIFSHHQHQSARNKSPATTYYSRALYFRLGVLRATICKYLTPAGVSIHHDGKQLSQFLQPIFTAHQTSSHDRLRI